MWKIFGGVVIGVFVGAFAVEVVKRARPELLQRVEQKARLAGDALFTAFQSGLDRQAEE